MPLLDLVNASRLANVLGFDAPTFLPENIADPLNDIIDAASSEGRVIIVCVDRWWEFVILDSTFSVQSNSSNLVTSHPVPQGALLDYSVRTGNIYNISAMIAEENGLILNEKSLEVFANKLGGVIGLDLSLSRLSAFYDTINLSDTLGGGFDGSLLNASDATLASVASEALEPRVQAIGQLLHKWKDQADRLFFYNFVFDAFDSTTQDDPYFLLEGVNTTSDTSSGLNLRVDLMVKEMKVAEKVRSDFSFGGRVVSEAVTSAGNLIKGLRF